jgi:hypothetical protein
MRYGSRRSFKLVSVLLLSFDDDEEDEEDDEEDEEDEEVLLELVLEAMLEF